MAAVADGKHSSGGISLTRKFLNPMSYNVLMSFTIWSTTAVTITFGSCIPPCLWVAGALFDVKDYARLMWDRTYWARQVSGVSGVIVSGYDEQDGGLFEESATIVDIVVDEWFELCDLVSRLCESQVIEHSGASHCEVHAIACWCRRRIRRVAPVCRYVQPHVIRCKKHDMLKWGVQLVLPLKEDLDLINATDKLDLSYWRDSCNWRSTLLQALLHFDSTHTNESDHKFGEKENIRGRKDDEINVTGGERTTIADYAA